MVDKKIAHYAILGKLGQGGMGVVYKARDTKLNRIVALKLLPMELVADEKVRRRFLQEALSAAAVTHPYIATIHEAGEDGDTLYIVMEYVEGDTLRSLLGRGKLESDEAIRLCTEVAEGLARAHQNNVVHRDLKPENIMISRDGHVKILDFGLAKILEAGAEEVEASSLDTVMEQLTVLGEVMGTPAYMSPEQARGQKVDARSDIFSFGSILYEALTGEAAFKGPTRVDTLSAVLNREPVETAPTPTELPTEAHRILRKALQKDVDKRYQSSQDLVLDLRELRSERSSLVGSRDTLIAPTARETKRTPARRFTRKWLLAGVAAAALALLAIGGRALFSNGSTREEPAARVAAPAKPNYILVAEFDTAEGQEDLANAARELVVAALLRSDVVTPLSRAQLRRGLRLAQKPADSRVFGDLARELASRAAAKAYVEGRVDRVGNGSSIVLHVTNVESGQLITSVNALAQNEGELIEKLDAICRQLREELGENKKALAQSRPLRESMTPSFEAFRAYTRAHEFQAHREFSESIRLLKQAVALDSSFASAWSLMGIVYANLGHDDSSRVALETALSNTDRLPEVQRLNLQAYIADVVEHDLLGALRIYDRLLVETPFVATAHSNRARVLFNLGRYEEALQAQVRLAEIRPFGSTMLHYNNRLLTLMQLGRFDEADQLSKELKGTARQYADLKLAHARGNWAVADSLARAYLETTSNRGLRFRAELTLATVAVIRGEMESATRILARVIPEAPSRFDNGVGRMAWTQLWIMARTLASSPPDEIDSDSTTADWIVRAIRSAVAGRTPVAMQALANARQRPGREQRRHAGDLALAEAWITASTGDWEAVIEKHGKSATGGQGPWFSGRIPIRWLLAESHEILGNKEAAAAAFELVLSPLRMHHDTWSWWGMASPFAHARLVKLYADMGRGEDARRHYAVLERTFTHADPQLLPILDQARADRDRAQSSP